MSLWTILSIQTLFGPLYSPSRLFLIPADALEVPNWNLKFIEAWIKGIKRHWTPACRLNMSQIVICFTLLDSGLRRNDGGEIKNWTSNIERSTSNFECDSTKNLTRRTDSSDLACAVWSEDYRGIFLHTSRTLHTPATTPSYCAPFSAQALWVHHMSGLESFATWHG